MKTPEEYDDLLPKPGEWIKFLGSDYNLTFNQYYQVISRDYQIQCAYYVCVKDDKGFQIWVPLVQFSLIDE